MRSGHPIVLACFSALLSGITLAQLPAQNPVYVDDAPLANEAMELIPSLLESDNHVEAIRVLQRLLDESAQRLIPNADDPDLFASVRRRVHAILLANPDLLDRYRTIQEPLGQTMLAEGGFAEVERTRLLTTSGYEAALRVTQRLLERGDFEAARIVVTQLSSHPDKPTAQSDDATVLLETIARYLDREDVWAQLNAWRGTETRRSPIEPPALVTEPKRTPMEPAGQIDLNEMVASPLHSTDLPGVQTTHGENTLNFEVFSPWAMPMVTSNELIVNDGGAISSWDRFTFQRRWVTRPTGMDMSNMLQSFRSNRRARSELQMRDVSAVDVQGNLVSAITGWVVVYSRGGVAQRAGDSRLHVLDRADGRVRWSWRPDMHSLDMAQAILIGRPRFVGDLVLVQVRKQVAARRSLGSYLFALDARTGDVRWSRLVGSSGSLPYQSQAGLISPELLVHEGIVYVSSEIGVIAAIEAWSGRFAWARVRGGATFGGYDPAPAHAVCPPVMADQGLFVLTADRSSVLRMDPAQGIVLGERGADRLGNPRYLLKVDGLLAAVGENQLTVTPMDGFERAMPRSVAYPANHRQVGRVVAAGDRLLAPVEGGLYEILARDIDRTRLLELQASGLITPTDGQLVACDSSSVHGYLVWSTAERVLSERMQEDPDDPTAAMTFAQLCVQAGRPERLVEALERALASIGRQRSDELALAYTDHLFELVLSMVRDDAFESAMIDQLIAVLETSARSPTQRVAHLIELGAQHDRNGNTREAINAFQGILLDDELAAATWPGSRLVVRADLEAARRVRDVLARNGQALYESYETMAQSELRAMGANAEPKALEQFARRYPASRATTQAWLAAADRYEASGQSHQAVRALRLGLQNGAGESVAHAELSGRLIMALMSQQQWGEAGRAVRSLDQTSTPTNLGVAVDLASVRQTVEQELRARQRRALIGAPLAQDLVFVGEWSLARTTLASDWAHIGYAPIEIRRETRVQLGAMRADATVAWERAFAPGTRIVRADPGSLLVMEGDDNAVRVAKLDAATGNALWQSEPIDLDEIGGDIEFTTPMDGPVRASELIAVADAHTLVIGTRAGRAIGIDLQSGLELWTARMPIRRVHDMAIGAGIIAVGGAIEPADATWPFLDASTPMIAALDARTGQAMYTAQGEAGGIESEIRWMRVALGGRVVAGVGQGVLSADPLAGELAWLNDEESLRGSLDAWIVGDRALVMAANRDLWSVTLETGRTDPAPLPTRSTTYARSRINVTPVESGLVVSSSRGVVVLDRGDAVLGADVIPAQDTLLPAEVGSGAMITVDTTATPSGREYPLYALDYTGRLLVKPIGVVLNQAIGPEGLTLLDNKVLISTGAGIVAVPAPVE